jgi:hypothetical protein
MATLTHPEVDSRAYAFVYPIRSHQHLPADFPVEAKFSHLISGIFLPQEQCGRFNRPRYPAHILLLFRDVLIGATHPSARVPEVRIPISEILAIESFRILLDGKLAVSAARSRHQWRYNTREERHVGEFLFHLREVVMPERGDRQKTSAFVFGSQLDFKFAGLESSELDPGERVLARFFSPPRQSVRKRWLFGVHVSHPGDYLALTTRRIIWITDRSGDHRAEYGAVSTYASSMNLLGLSVRSDDQNHELTVELKGGLRWTMPTPAELRSRAEAFVNEVNWLS